MSLLQIHISSSFAYFAPALFAYMSPHGLISNNLSFIQ